MMGWNFAVSRRWAGYLALTILFAAVCSGLGVWQLARRDEALTELFKIDSNFDSNPVPVTEALPELTDFDESQKWMPVELTGTYLVGDEMLARNRPLNVNPGFEVLTPFLLTDGTIFIVDRGWLPTGQEQDAPDTVPAPPTGTVTVVARLKASEPDLPGRTASGNQVATINLSTIAERLNEPTYTGAYGLMAKESPAATEARPTAVLKPIRDEGPHLSYAFQWFVFGLLAFIGLGWALREEYRSVNAHDPEERERADERARKRAAKPLNDAEIEDQLLDRQLH
ncbi:MULTISPECIES: SURF1 family protein [Cryobacterium]|uniref:SURF1-like protein n=1 Tax=Cryobacterium gelidum TaxID=1259164 RepID=A0A4R9ARV6_9MICO|nr:MULTISPECIES: SURF1 family protein [Cryobacterium]TFB70008.1 SURF1 family protein [Cryobacterium sp. Hz9]TFD68631.1 SURF1 family protein [Cryobacterium gelidum]